MAIPFLNIAWKSKKVIKATKFVFVSLADQANDDGWCWPRVEKIAERTGYSERTVQYALRKLERLGLIQVVYRKGRASYYRVLSGANNAPTPANKGTDTPAIDAPITIINNQQETMMSIYKDQAIKVIKILNEVSGKNFRLVDTNFKPVIALLKDGFTVDDIANVIRRKARSSFKDGEWRMYLRPETLFRKSKFEAYYAEIPTEEEKDEMP